MSIIKLIPENFQTYKPIATPKKIFHSRSSSGVTGSIALFSDASPRLKEVYQSFGESEEGFSDDEFETFREEAFSPVDPRVSAYMEMVNEKPQGKALSKRQEVLQ